MGVDTVVVWDRVWLDDELIEDTMDGMPRMRAATSGISAKIPKEYVAGQFVGTSGSWEAGVAMAPSRHHHEGQPESR